MVLALFCAGELNREDRGWTESPDIFTPGKYVLRSSWGVQLSDHGHAATDRRACGRRETRIPVVPRNLRLLPGRRESFQRVVMRERSLRGQNMPQLRERCRFAAVSHARIDTQGLETCAL